MLSAHTPRWRNIKGPSRPMCAPSVVDMLMIPTSTTNAALCSNAAWSSLRRRTRDRSVCGPPASVRSPTAQKRSWRSSVDGGARSPIPAPIRRASRPCSPKGWRPWARQPRRLIGAHWGWQSRCRTRAPVALVGLSPLLPCWRLVSRRQPRATVPSPFSSWLIACRTPRNAVEVEVVRARRSSSRWNTFSPWAWRTRRPHRTMPGRPIARRRRAAIRAPARLSSPLAMAAAAIASGRTAATKSASAAGTSCLRTGLCR
mmetsp:Transcript_89528/g.252248  ORF Transcript_89528/g.252248 Transcript_89528/m.252248 type:complete len:258 (-) Transcript_89528:481-1254(-)